MKTVAGHVSNHLENVKVLGGAILETGKNTLESLLGGSSDAVRKSKLLIPVCQGLECGP